MKSVKMKTLDSGIDDIEQTLFPLMLDKKPYHVFEQQEIINHIHFYFTQEVGEAYEYVEMIHKLNSATENDIFYFHINTIGGDLSTGCQIMTAMRNTAGHIVTILEADTHSLGTMLLLSGQEIIIHDDCLMMIHNFRGGVIGTGGEMRAELAATTKWFDTLAKRIYVPFMSDEEFDRMINGQDFWFQSSEIIERLHKVAAIAEKEADETNEDDSKTESNNP